MKCARVWNVCKRRSALLFQQSAAEKQDKCGRRSWGQEYSLAMYRKETIDCGIWEESNNEKFPTKLEKDDDFIGSTLRMKNHVKAKR